MNEIVMITRTIKKKSNDKNSKVLLMKFNRERNVILFRMVAKKILE